MGVRGDSSGFRNDLFRKCGFRRFCEAYNPGVARGWESKAIEAQQADAAEKNTIRRKPMSAKQAVRQRERETLELSRRSVLRQLEGSQNPRHAQVLRDALQELDEKLKRTAEE
jgi:hypothetical protein